MNDYRGAKSVAVSVRDRHFSEVDSCVAAGSQIPFNVGDTLSGIKRAAEGHTGCFESYENSDIRVPDTIGTL